MKRRRVMSRSNAMRTRDGVSTAILYRLDGRAMVLFNVVTAPG